MKRSKGHRSEKLSPNRQVVIASATVTREKNAIHAFTEIDISEPRRLLKEHFERTDEKLSFTAYIVTCLAKVVKENPQVNSFIKGRRQVFLDDITISVLVEREIDGEKVPEPIAVKHADVKSFREINNEIKAAQKLQSKTLGSLSGISWIRFIPGFLLKVFVSIADKNIRMAKRYGKVAVTAIGMFSKESVWFIPHGSATVLITVGSINNKVVELNENFTTREHLCITASFDHNIFDGAPAMRFFNRFIKIVKGGELLKFD